MVLIWRISAPNRPLTLSALKKAMSHRWLNTYMAYWPLKENIRRPFPDEFHAAFFHCRTESNATGLSTTDGRQTRGAHFKKISSDLAGWWIFRITFHEDFKNVNFVNAGHTLSTHNFCPRSPCTGLAAGCMGRIDASRRFVWSKNQEGYLS